ncbi:phage tail protein [Hymenobacter elongatus]|uniref:Phage tail protein n=1 Tax=Hymenobacter elongatus TaxID=877208 RepID=A0A4Z0PEZ2_9BACT|nr:tail fiber protein [Hymenobacter elongatus]TGE12812.1 phage tail protein [Hymenobacter elongatus]
MDEYIGIIKLFAGSFAPKNWAFCNGQLLPIAQNQALFSILGTMYGGNGTTTFALPNLNGRVAVGTGQLAGGSNYDQGQVGGMESVTLTSAQMPAHTHQLVANTGPGNTTAPAGALLSVPAAAVASSGDEVTVTAYASAATTLAPMNPSSLTPTGESLPHENRPPYLALPYIICLYGAFPPRD